MNLKEKNNVLRLALENINYIVSQNAGNNPDDVEKQYDCNKAAFDEIAKVLANTIRFDIFDGDLPKRTYFTPKAAMETIAGDRPLDAIFANPPLEGFAKFLSVPALGIRFNRHRSKALTTLVATWRDEANDHIYEVRVQPDGDTPNCGWRATATNDGHRVFTLTTKNRTNCEHFALSAMKRYLKRGHRRTYRTLAKANKEVA